MGRLARSKEDVRHESEGVWVDYYDGIRIKVARTGNPKQIQTYDQMTKKYQKKGFDKQPMLKRRAVNSAVLARTVLMDWSGVEDENGKNLKYTIEEGEKTLNNDISFYHFVSSESDDESVFRLERLESTGKKSKAG